MSNKTSFAAFVMTYCRVTILENTINTLFSQTVPPQKILIIDNDPLQSAEFLINKYDHWPLEYHAVGYNSGPAGAAKIGLETLAKQGFKWIAWMDDDDPPLFDDVFEILLKISLSENKCGSVGVAGQYFCRKTGLIKRVPDLLLEGGGMLRVDNIAGNMSKIVNAEVCLSHFVYPDENLFFGFEELDFDLRLKQAGFVLLADKELYKRHRLKWNRVGIHVKRGIKKEVSRLWRDYYSIRNGMVVMKKNKHYAALVVTFLRALYKIFSGFKYGYYYGKRNAKVNLMAIAHFAIGRKGQFSVK